MCGLAGWTSTTAGAEPGALTAMVEALSHRNTEEGLCAVIDRHNSDQVRRLYLSVNTSERYRRRCSGTSR